MAVIESKEELSLSTAATPCSLLLADGVSIDPRLVVVRDDDGNLKYGTENMDKMTTYDSAYDRFMLEVGTRSAAFDVIFNSDFDVPIYPFLNKIFEPLATLTCEITFPYTEYKEASDFWVEFHRLTASLTSSARGISSIFLDKKYGVNSRPPFDAEFIKHEFGSMFRIVFAYDVDCPFPFPVIVPAVNLDSIKGLQGDYEIWYYINVFKMTMFELVAHWMLMGGTKLSELINAQHKVPIWENAFQSAPNSWWSGCFGRRTSQYGETLARDASIEAFIARFGDILPVAKYRILDTRVFNYSKGCYDTLSKRIEGGLKFKDDYEETESNKDDILFLRAGNINFTSLTLNIALNRKDFIANVCKYDRAKWSNNAKWVFCVGRSITVTKALHGIQCFNRWGREGKIFSKIMQKTVSLLMMSNAAGVWGVNSPSADADYGSALTPFTNGYNVYGSYQLANNVFYPLRKMSFLYGPELRVLETAGIVMSRPSNMFMHAADTVMANIPLNFRLINGNPTFSVPTVVTQNVAGFMSKAGSSIVATAMFLLNNKKSAPDLAAFLLTMETMIDQNPEVSIDRMLTAFFKNLGYVETMGVVGREMGKLDATTVVVKQTVNNLLAMISGEMPDQERWAMITLYMLREMRKNIGNPLLTTELLFLFGKWLRDPGIMAIIPREYGDAWIGDIKNLRNGTLIGAFPNTDIIDTAGLLELQEYVGSRRTLMCDALVSMDTSRQMSQFICPKELYQNSDIVLSIFPGTASEYKLYTLKYGIPKGTPNTPDAGFTSYIVPAATYLSNWQTYQPICWVVQCVPQNTPLPANYSNDSVTARKQAQRKEALLNHALAEDTRGVLFNIRARTTLGGVAESTLDKMTKMAKTAAELNVLETAAGGFFATVAANGYKLAYNLMYMAGARQHIGMGF